MVLAQLGGSISRALQQMSNATIIDEKVLNDCLNEITRALLQADVQFKLVRDMQTNIKKIVNLDDLAAGHNKRKIIQQFRFVFLGVGWSGVGHGIELETELEHNLISVS
ncbi:UNVERIFIED_CONTAM: Signal recognition particle protein 2 [Sesamum angustifolium]|uniref:Signal recognition particle protein 2 n=1 Tax=Sesamum angustifolium TaxID=2727405 RepID=A0AAW2LJC5_9LAMI